MAKKKNPKIYFITLISAYEEVFEEKIPNLEKLKNELNELEEKAKKEKMAFFLYSINRRQIISENVSQKIQVYNPYEESKGFRKTRTPMFFFSKEKAIKAIEKNYADLLEGGSWGSPLFVVIEEYEEGFNLCQNRDFYEIDFKKNKVKKIKEPVWAKSLINFAIG